MNDPPLTPGIAAAASTTATSPSLFLLPLALHPGESDGEVEGEEEGLEVVTDRGVAVGNGGRPHLPSPPLSFPAPPPLSLACCSQSASRRPGNEAV